MEVLVATQGWVILHQVSATFGGTFGSETATVTVTATFSDGQTTVWTIAAAASGTSGNSSNDLASLMRDNTHIAQLSFTLQSSIAGSQVTATARVVATEV
ncbi:hypothetical protein [Longimycelium tulufanense]|uniref:hypothetical protein n=1 Tax=Longimycelium tulufanense TaxID=907463 RepID=UPI0016661301|nr:hypothetical protein [Longimycelium tulufanense]